MNIEELIELSSIVPDDDTIISDLYEFLNVVGYKFKQDKVFLWNSNGWRKELEFAMPKNKDSFTNLTKNRIIQSFTNARFTKDNIHIAHNKLIKLPKSDNIKSWSVRRAQSHVSVISHIVIESDTETLETQVELFEALKPYVSAVVYSGNKSIHIWIKIPNINPKNQYQLKRYHLVSANLSKHMKLNNITYDIGVVTDYSKLARIPNTINSKSGRLSKLLYTNENVIEFNETKQFYTKSYKDNAGTIGDIGEKYIMNSDNSDVTFLDNSKSEEPIVVKKDIIKISDFIASIPNYHDNLDRYYNYMSNGMPDKGYRNSMYRDVIIANRILTGYDFYKYVECSEKIGEKYIMNSDNSDVTFLASCIESLTQILELSEGRYEGTFEYAIEDFKVFLQKSILMKAKIKLPNLTTIEPQINDLKAIKTNLKQLGYKESHYIAKLIKEVLADKIINTPLQCKKGKLSIHCNKELRGSIKPNKMRSTMNELKEKNIMLITANYSVEHGQTNKYWLNIPLILYVATNASELDWSQYKTK